MASNVSDRTSPRKDPGEGIVERGGGWVLLLLLLVDALRVRLAGSTTAGTAVVGLGVGYRISGYCAPGLGGGVNRRELGAGN